jgi:hypothetical protein
MDEVRRKRKRAARERQMVRQRRQEIIEGVGAEYESAKRWVTADGWRRRAIIFLQDGWWYITHSPLVKKGLAIGGGILFVLFVAIHVVTGRIFPNVWVMGVSVGDMTLEEAEAALTDAWDNRIQIELIDEDRRWTVTPTEIGLLLDAKKTAEAARGVGMSGIPMGYSITPFVSVDELAAQTFLLDVTAMVNVAPYNAGYEWQGDQLVGMAGRDGRVLDVPLTMQRIMQEPSGIVLRRRLELLMTPLLPDVADPAPYLEAAQHLASQPFEFTGYDPFTDETVAWGTTREVVASWLEAGRTGLTLREDVFAPFIEAQNATLNSPGQQIRYLDPADTKDRVNEAITSQATQVHLRIRYRSSTYEIVAGDTGLAISRKTGIPFYLIEEVNPSLNWNGLSVGQQINLPSRDLALPMEPVPNKRIIVDLDTQSLVAYENGQEVFRWAISSGIDSAPTSPGIFQILTHNDVASGSSFTLCDNTGLDCGQWQMYWFMGIYEVTPGLMNGFHGAVLLPNGAYLGGGNVGSPFTFGCVMSLDSNAQQLYQWAEEGTVVEILSHEFQPQSQLARTAFAA